MSVVLSLPYGNLNMAATGELTQEFQAEGRIRRSLENERERWCEAEGVAGVRGRQGLEVRRARATRAVASSATSGPP